MKPTFLVIGAAKSGTTSLYHFLRQHPDIYLPDIKELNYFGGLIRRIRCCGPKDQTALARSVLDWRSYENLLMPGENYLATGEISPVYLYDPMAAEEICRVVPECRLIVILRHPAERAFSNFLMMRRDQREPCGSFRRALSKEEKRREAGWEWGWMYKDKGYYGRQLERYFRLFPREQILIFLYEEFVKDPLNCLASICRFIGVNDGFSFQLSARYNESIIKKSMAAEKLLWSDGPMKQTLRRLLPEEWLAWGHSRLYKWNRVKPQIPAKIYRELTESYKDDLLLLQDLIGRDLSSWIDCANSAG